MNKTNFEIDRIDEPLRVLILDDEENLRRLMRICLQKSGCEVDAVVNGREGLQRLLRQHYDVVVTDYRMAEMDGLTFIQEALILWPWLGVVLISCFLGEKELGRAKELGVSRILEKPVSNEGFVRNVLEEGASSRRRNADNRSQTPQLIHHQVNILRQIAESALKGRSLQHAMEQLAIGLQGMVHCDLVGVLGLEDNGGYLLVQAEAPQRQNSVAQVQHEMVTRYQALTGRPLSREQLQTQVKGEVTSNEDISEIQHITSVPVIANDRVLGMLTLAFTHAAKVSAVDTHFLYHAANHFSTVLQAVGEIRKLAIHDPLTGAYNRRYLDAELERIWLLASRYEHIVAAIILDVDDFKSINDTHGHLAGDGILTEFAGELRAMTRASDLLVRLGGDEFVLILPQTQAHEPEELAQRILSHVREHVFCQDSQKIQITTTIGIALSRPGGKIFSHKELLDNADQALYWAKRRGRNQIALWSPEGEFAGAWGGKGGGEALTSERSEGASRRKRVLLLNEQPWIRSNLLPILDGEGYLTEVAGSVGEARELLRGGQGMFHLLLTEFSLNGKGGENFLKEAKELDPSLVRMVVGEPVTVEKAVASLREGAYDIVSLPCEPSQVTAQLTRAMEYWHLLNENREHQLYLEAMVREKSMELTLSLEEVKASYEFALEAMVGMLDAREYETCRHSQRVMALTKILAAEMGISEPDLSEIARGALLHDIGKIAIPDSILLKPGPLREDEWEVMRTHPEVGYNLLKSNMYLKTAAEMVYCHHESYNGKGYPRGLKAEQIPLSARIFSVIDSYDAMRSPRVYKASISKEAALREILAQSGLQFDPVVTEAFLQVVDRLEVEGQWPGEESRIFAPEELLVLPMSQIRNPLAI
ncbi:MAG: diguanylate cyclase [Verrucomicrobia bacterium]|nr:diguanylate cyclase [Verrucomicrobiota bacterium]MCH8512687.1 diguanylate cyclase [Kiritimatiellia bacterium]